MKYYTIPVGPLQANCYILASQAGNAAIVDPGGQAEHIARGLGTLGLTPQWVLLTHGHCDHVGALAQLREIYPQLRVAAGRQEADLLADPEKNLAARIFGGGEDYTGLAADLLLDEGDTVALDELSIVAIATPGHTAGGLTYRCGDLLFTGDTLFAGSVGRTDFYSGDSQALLESIQRLFALEGEYTVLPGHGEPTTLSVERVSNPYARL